jgi:hypothetical protein
MMKSTASLPFHSGETVPNFVSTDAFFDQQHDRPRRGEVREGHENVGFPGFTVVTV